MVPSRRDLLGLSIVFGFGAVVLGVLAYMNRSAGPVLWDDEGTYLWVASGFARGERWPLLTESPLYSASFSVLLAPVIAVLGQARVYESALVVNAGAMLVLAGCGWRLAREVLSLSTRQSVVAVGVALAYPSLGIQVVRAWPEAVVTALVMVLALAIARYVQFPDLPRFLVLVLSAFVAFAMHKRMLAPVALLPLAPLLPAQLPRRDRFRHAALGLATVPISFFVVARIDALALQGVGGKSRENKVTGGLAPSEWLDVATSLAGQLWSMQVASLGLAGLAVIVGFRASEGAERRWAAGMLALLVLSAGITSSFLRTSLAVDHVFYTRYLEVFGPCLALWAVSLILRRPSDAVRGWGVGVAVALAMVPLVRWFRIDDFESGIVKIRIAGLLGPNALVRDFGAPVSLIIEVATLSGMLVAFVGLVGLLIRHIDARLGVAVVLVAQLALGVVAAGWSMRPWLDIAESTGASAASTLVDQGVDQVTVVTIGDSGPVGRAIAFQSDYRVQPIGMTWEQAATECPTTRFVLVDPGVGVAFEGKQVGDSHPFRALLMEVLSCPNG